MLNKINIHSERQKLIVYVVLTVVTFAVFWQVNQYAFVNIDDLSYVTDNFHVQSGITLDGFRWAFSTTLNGFWHPLTWLSLMFDYKLYGLNAGGYHLTNLILHILSTLLLFWLFNRMTGAIWRSAFVAAFFALHPLHVQSVAWIAERKDVLSAFFWTLTLCLYVYYIEKPVIRRYLLVLLSFACALMSKSMVVTLPVVMIILDYWPLGRLQSKKIGSNLTNILPVSTYQGAQKGNMSPPIDQKLSKTKIAEIIPLWQFWEKIPFFILSAAFSIGTVFLWYNPSKKLFSLGFRIATALVSFVTYLEKTFWPHDMAIFYPFSNQLNGWQVLGAALLILVISATVIVMVKRLPYLLVGWLWYAITILPVIGIIYIGINPMSDRYTYLPSIGIAIMLAWGIPPLFPREDIRKKILFPAGIACLAIMAILSWKQCGYWKNSIELFKHDLQVTKDDSSCEAHTHLGMALFAEGKIEEAIDHYNEAIRVKPGYLFAYDNRGTAYATRGQYQLAIKDFSEVIRVKPDFALGYVNRGTAYATLGQYQLAIEDFNQTIRLEPDYANAYYKRGDAYATRGQYQLAIKDFSEVIRVKPDSALGYNKRGAFYFDDGANTLGCSDAQKACELGNCNLLEMAKGKGLCPFANQAWAADWTYYASSNIGKEYYDKSSIKKVNENIISVWIKIILNEDARRKIFSSLKSIGKAPENPDILNHQLMLIEIDCVNKKVKSSHMTINDAKGVVIAPEPESFISKWNDIPSDSNADILKNIVCSTVQTSKTKKK
jgi:tetratricopeptide (TPR) repeat protein